MSDRDELTAPGPIAGSRSTPAYGPECAFDPGMMLPWVTRERHEDVAANAWIGWDYGESFHEHVLAFEIQQWDGGENPNIVPRVALEYSDDAFDRHAETLQCFNLNGDTQLALIELAPHEIFARSWRIRALKPTGGGCWGIQRLRFFKTGDLAERPSCTTPG